MKVVDTKSGNPYHDNENGQFTEKNNNDSNDKEVGANTKEKKSHINLVFEENFDPTWEEDLLDLDDDIDSEESLDSDDNISSKDDFDSNDNIGLEDDFDLDFDLDEVSESDEFYDLDLDENTATLTSEEKEKINNYSLGELEKNIINSNKFIEELDKQKIFNASIEELRELLKALIIIGNKNKLLLQNKELSEIDNCVFPGLWLKDVTPSDYKDLKANWVKKYNYFKNEYSGEDKNKKIQDLLKFKELGEFYESSYNELFSDFKKYEDLIDKYIDLNSIYSKKRKDNAIWIKSNVVSQSLKTFGPKANQIIDKMKIDDIEAWASAKYYTGSYSIFNEPLRGEMYYGADHTPYGFVKTVTNMTRAIDYSTYDFDYWVQRGTSQLKINDSLMLNSYTDENTLAGLVGQTFKHQSFYSAGAGKGTGFSEDIIINTYCPKGTKGLYMNTQGYYAGGGENEMILQRGYTYKITKVQKKGGVIYLDADVILNSDNDKYSYEKLEEISQKYISG